MIDTNDLMRKATLVAQVGLRNALAGQQLAAICVAASLRGAGLAVNMGDYAGFRSVEVLGRNGIRVIAAPLFDWDPESNGPRDERWEFAVRAADGTLVPRPDGDDAWGCLDIWDVVNAGLRLDQGIASFQDVMTLAGDLLGWVPATTAGVAGPVRPGQSAKEYAPLPYPGERPTGSWVLDRDGDCWPAAPDEGMPSGWAVQSAPDTSECLDAWLLQQDAPCLADRVPVLSYGSNACPAKVLSNGTPLPSVNLACQIEGLASVWCAGATATGRTPVTLTASPGHSETAVVTMASTAELQVLDNVEGRRGNWYALQVLHTGRVVLENGARLLRPAAYVGARPERYPLLFNGQPVPRADFDYDAAALLVPLAGEQGVRPQAIGDDVRGGYPHPGECTPALFSYGTLMPGQSRWHLIADEVSAPPLNAEVAGDLRDTGRGFPALSAAADRKAPGVLCLLRPEAMAKTLDVLDQVEGTKAGLFSRQLSNVGGTLAWVYIAGSCSGTGDPIQMWP